MDQGADIEQLLVATGRGDRAAFDALYEAVAPRLHALCLAILKDRRIAEEVLADVFVRIWQHARRFDQQGLSAMAWLVTLTRNRALDRRAGRRRGLSGGRPKYDIPSSRRPSQSAARTALLPDISALSRDEKAAIRAVYLEGRDHAALSEAGAGTVPELRTWLRRALVSLRGADTG